LDFFSNFAGRFWPFLTEGLAFFEKKIWQPCATHADGVSSQSLPPQCFVAAMGQPATRSEQMRMRKHTDV